MVLVISSALNPVYSRKWEFARVILPSWSRMTMGTPEYSKSARYRSIISSDDF